MDIVQELQALREEIREMDERLVQLIVQVQTEQTGQADQRTISARDYETIYSLNGGTGRFKGKRPTAVLFPDGTRVECPTWKRVMEEILKDCCKDPVKKQVLSDLRGKVMGRRRVLLGSEEGNMRSPVKIADAIFVETHYDTESLLRILTTRILNASGYDYSGIRIAVHSE